MRVAGTHSFGACESQDAGETLAAGAAARGYGLRAVRDKGTYVNQAGLLKAVSGKMAVRYQMSRRSYLEPVG